MGRQRVIMGEEVGGGEGDFGGEGRGRGMVRCEGFGQVEQKIEF